MLHIFDAENKQLTVLKDETAETFKAKIIASASEIEEDFDYDIWLDECQYTLINAGDVQVSTVSNYIEW